MDGLTGKGLKVGKVINEFVVDELLLNLHIGVGKDVGLFLVMALLLVLILDDAGTGSDEITMILFEESVNLIPARGDYLKTNVEIIGKFPGHFILEPNGLSPVDIVGVYLPGCYHAQGSGLFDAMEGGWFDKEIAALFYLNAHKGK
jgi:hypothetical protein